MENATPKDADARTAPPGVSDQELKMSGILGAGAVLACLWIAKNRTALRDVQVVTENGQATNQIRIWLDGFAFPYTITVERYEEPF